MDLQPKSFKIKVKENEYDCKPLKMAHRLIIAKLQPFFEQFINISKGKSVELGATEMLSLEEDLDILIKDLMPSLQNITLDVEDIASIISQLLDSVMPEDNKIIRDAKIVTNSEDKKEDSSLKEEKS